MAGIYQQNLYQGAHAVSSIVDSAVTNISPVDDTFFNDSFPDLWQFKLCQRGNLTNDTIKWLQLPCITMRTFQNEEGNCKK